ncbi:hypothetical protein P154DRAFT_123128 [Amniculicola lignicola CBS 123094]|uniref:Homeobox domain-containing protein n=1 Tax=Amniculicola lignicola CBS 123094 TaxID=1392246 RepID=A0A6A5WPW6_9PLEO|nr:hypothetical protein P154DRAFT_123128 [Amniculicola lignicola CBS 123094]
MDQFGSQMRSFTGQGDAASQQRQCQPPALAGPPKPPNGPPNGPPKPHHNACADVKPRLTKEQHDILEAHFQQQHKPSTSTKKGFAETLGVPLDKINNWFQNRRAKVKQDLKKQINQYNMNMGFYSQPQMPVTTTQFAEQPQPQPHLSQDFFPVNADISPTCLPVQSVEGPSALDLGPQMPMHHQQFDMRGLRSIPEADRSTAYHPNALMESFMAATAGPSYMQNHQVSLPPQDSGFSYNPNGLPQSFPGELAFSVPSSMPSEMAHSNDMLNGFGDLSALDYASLAATNTSSSAEAQHSTGSISSEPSPFSGAQSTSTTQSSAGPNTSSVTSIASVYSNWTEEPTSGPEATPANQCEDPFDAPYSMPHAAASEHTLSFWGPQDQSFSHTNMYQHHNSSAQAIMPSPDHSEGIKHSPSQSEFDVKPHFADDEYSRRNSSATNLAQNIEAIHLQGGHTPDGFKQPNPPSSIAARRQKMPTALNSSTLRSASYTSGMPSPGAPNEHSLRRIRSSGIGNNGGRVQKPNPGSAQRSPMSITFSDAAASPKFARTFSTSSTTTLGQGGNLAPPTPLTPNEMARFPSWQSNVAHRNPPLMPEHSSPDSLGAGWSAEPPSAGWFSNAASPPSTPMGLGQLNQARLANENLYRDTPPQSAPATQQTFPRSFHPPPHMRTAFRSTTDLTIEQPKPSHFRRPSLPDAGHSQLDGLQLQYSSPFGYDPNMSLEGINHNVPFAPPIAMPEFLVHEYNPSPHHGGAPVLLRRTTEPQQKSYIFANQGPHDFKT